jgi:Flp pilus assembly protein CpaB
MKWSVVVLVILGVVAAACAALLVVSLQSGGTNPGPAQAPVGSESREVSYAVAARDLDARSVVESSAVQMVTAAPGTKSIPENAFTQPAEVVGQVLRKPVKKGQPFDRSCFTAEGTGVVLAGALKDGKRAVSLPLSDASGIEGLLYPGCLVDVLASLQLKDDKGLGDQPMSMTLLQGIYVLAVGDQTVVTPQNPGEIHAKSSSPTITLLVDTKQAEMLYLARQRGSVSIVLRNPMDTIAVGSEGTRLSNLSPVFADAEKRMIQVTSEASQRDHEKAEYEMERARQDIELSRKQSELARLELDKKKIEAERSAEESSAPQWETRVLHGGVEEVRKFDVVAAKPEPKPDHKP